MKTELKFIKKTHTYTFGDKTLISVTKFISQFFKEFNEKEMAKLMAIISRKKGIKGQGIRYWKKHWKEMSQHGTRVHLALEDFINSGQTPKQEQDDLQKTIAGVSYIVQTRKELGRVYEYRPEVKIFDENLGIAGTIDLMIVKGKEIHLVDWKTNKKIEQQGYKGTRAKPPLNHLQDCNYIKYSLQLNMYRHLLELQGFDVKSMSLIHLLPDGTYKKYSISSMKKEVEDLLNEKNKK
jgi:ATP-dependent exoDNAse (exonuclease V) beta subunit